ncbi:MAG: DUF1192 domain-containing protein [Roseomonas sp.]
MAPIEDEERPRRAPRFQPMVFDGWDVAQLREYIEALQAEISRAEAAIGARDAQRLAAEAFFKKG